ncbi:DNA-directed RNA polymerase subunit beta [bacterium]|nr:MAG: DNA-directed RNA polymerase subunit beta [bacterium]
MEEKKFSGFPKKNLPLPNLIEIQLNSYKWFFEEGLKSLFQEISPIVDYSGKELELSFIDYYLDEPKHTEISAREHNASYEASLKVRLNLENKKTAETKEQDIFMGDFPLMTNRGTFILNGVERVIVSQLARSPGVFFNSRYENGRHYFGAKIIPNRGAWLEFETDNHNTIYVKVDRKRKMPVTAFLRAFSGIREEEKPLIDTNDNIKEIFKDSFKTDEFDYIDASLAKDLTNNQPEGLIDIYRRIRPGELATPDNARSLLKAMFSFERYDLSEVGRWKIKQRLGLNSPQQNSKKKQKIGFSERILSIKDIVLIVKEIIKLNQNPQARPDDIDHLSNRRIKCVGELLLNRVQVGFARMTRIIKDRMSTLDIYTLAPAQLINIRPLAAVVREFFISSRLSQFMDQVNPLAELEHKRRVSSMGPGGLTKERAGFEVRDVHPSHYGRLCPIQTPEGPNIGLVNHISTYASLNKYGFLITPYWQVKGGKVTDEVVYLTADEEENYVIAPAGEPLDDKNFFKNKKVEARIKTEPGLIESEKVDFVDVAPNQSISVATSLIPFLEHDDANRALMGSNMQRQAVSCVIPEAPFVGTGMEKRTAIDSGMIVTAENAGIVMHADAQKIIVKETKANKIKEYSLANFRRSNQYTCIHQRPLVKKGNRVKKGEVLADGPAIDGDVLALGQNLLVAFISWEGFNFEDAIIISEKVVRDDRFSSIHIEDFMIDVRDTRLGPEVTTPDIPNVGEERLKDLNEEGIVRIGAQVKEGDILVGKISPKGETDLTSEERLLRSIFGEKARDIKDSSLTLPHGKKGRVIGVRVFSQDKGDKLSSGVIKSVQVEVALFKKIEVGDKLSGRHGNKGVISKVLSEEDMPHLKDGTPVDIVLNPLGVASRMNIGQILETHLGMIAKSLGCRALSPSLSGVKESEIRDELKKANYPETGKFDLYDGRTGKKFDQPVTVGYIYMMKLNHLVSEKIHMRSIGPYSLITQQPLGGKSQFGGQRFGEMEVWALEGYGAAYTLQEMLTIKSDDVLGRAAAYEAIIRGQEIINSNIPASFNVLLNELRGLGFSIELLGKKILKREEDGR